MTREDPNDVESRKRMNMKDMPAEFFLPPQSNAALWDETVKLVVGSLLFLVVLGIIVAMTQGIVIKL